jgi:hypothetical protein
MGMAEYNGLFLIFFASMMVVVPALFVAAYKMEKEKE